MYSSESGYQAISGRSRSVSINGVAVRHRRMSRRSSLRYCSCFLPVFFAHDNHDCIMTRRVHGCCAHLNICLPSRRCSVCLKWIIPDCSYLCVAVALHVLSTLLWRHICSVSTHPPPSLYSIDRVNVVVVVCVVVVVVFAVAKWCLELQTWVQFSFERLWSNKHREKCYYYWEKPAGRT